MNRDHENDSNIMLARVRASNRGASPVEVERNVLKLWALEFDYQAHILAPGYAAMESRGESTLLSISPRVYRNVNYDRRNYECTNVVACEAHKDPGSPWKLCGNDAGRELLDRLTMLYRQAGVSYYGYL